MVAGPQETTERKRPARCCAAIVRGRGAGAASASGGAVGIGRGSHAGGAGWGGRLPVCFRSQSRSACCFVRFAAAFPARRCKLGSTLPRGCRCRFAPALAGSAARASQAMPHLTKGRSPCPEGAAERRRGMVRRRALRTAIRPAQGPRVTRCCRCCCRCYLPPPRSGGVQGGAFHSPVCVGRRNEKRGSAHRALPLVLD